MLEKTYNPAEIETKHYGRWEEANAFAAQPDSNQKPFTIVIPPPNVTGSLHMGHALNNTLQDVLIRYQRMNGRDALWQPGTDHAGIATQMVVERQLDAQGISRHDMGREAFIKRVWEWKAESGGTITGQLRRLGSSADWARERFTMDEGLSAAVIKVFVDLHKQGLIYQDKRLVNWDSKLLTAISDLEVESREVKGYLWYLRYPIDGVPDRHIVVATTRPETMLGDTAVAVHPDDPRFADLIGKYVLLPIVNRRIPIVADEYSDPEKGSGAVKITPAHDFNDFEVGKRHNLEVINIFDQHARLNENAPAEYQGMDRYAAREKIVAAFEHLGLVEKIEPHTHTVPYGDRSGVAIEPWLTEQWYVDAKTLAQAPIEAVKSGRIELIPKSEERTFFQWMDNIQPWCVSRQLWWGHQIPAWYGPDGHFFVELDEAAAKAAAKAHYGKDVALDTRQGRARHLVLLGAVAVLDPGLARADARSEALLPDRRAGHRQGHPVLLGGAHDDDGPALHEGSALPHRLPARAGDGREGAENVQVQGQHHRPAGPDRQIRRRCAALHHGVDGRPGPPDQAFDPESRRQSQLRDQAVERGALLRGQWLPTGAGLRSGCVQADLEQMADQRADEIVGARAPKRSSSSASTTWRTSSTASSGARIATGTWNSPSRCWRATTRRRRPRYGQ